MTPTTKNVEPTTSATDELRRMSKRESSTECLRRLLDERGVEWRKPSPEYWVLLGMPEGDSSTIVGELSIEEATDGTLVIRNATPEQAVEATLGREPDDAAMVKLHNRMNAALLEYERTQGIEKRDGDGKVVVPFVAEMHSLLEEAATLGSSNRSNSERMAEDSDGRGECRALSFEGGFCNCDAGDYEEFWEPACKCSACGELIPMRNYCPNCGRKLVKE